MTAETPEEAVAIWYRALNARDRDLLDAILLRDPGRFYFGPEDSMAYEIEEKDVLDTDEEAARHEGVERGDVIILTTTRNPETGETYPGDFLVVRETDEGWKIEGYSTRQYIPEEVQ